MARKKQRSGEKLNNVLPFTDRVACLSRILFGSRGTDDPACTQFAEQAELTLIFAFDEVREYMVNRYDGGYPVD